MDGLLLDSERDCVIAFNDTVQSLALPPMPEVALACIGLRSDAVRSTIHAALAERVDFDAFYSGWRQRIDEVFAKGIPVKTGVLPLLDALKAQGTPCAVATSTRTSSAEAHLQKAGLRGYFKAVIGGEQVANGKPAPDIYLMAAKALGLSPPECMAFEDSDPGTLADIASGATVVQVPDVKPPGATLLALGHTIASSVLSGARQKGLLAI